MNEDFEKRRVFDSPPTFYLPMSMWMGYGMPLYEINQEHYENGSDDLYRHKILTNVRFELKLDNNKNASR